jgi:hypothetical protein
MLLDTDHEFFCGHRAADHLRRSRAETFSDAQLTTRAVSFRTGTGVPGYQSVPHADQE